MTDRLNKINKNGFSLFEIVLALALFFIVSSSLLVMVAGSFVNLTNGSDLLRADQYTREAHEALRTISLSAWNELEYESSDLARSNGSWVLAGEGSSNTFDGFARSIVYDDVYRNGQNELAAAGSPGAALDLLSKKATVAISWDSDRSAPGLKNTAFYLSAWNAVSWTQNDWSGGGGQTVWLDASKYDQDSSIDINGQNYVELEAVSTTTYSVSGSLISSAFNADEASSFIYIKWEENECAACDIRLRIQTAPDNAGSPGEWSAAWCGPDGEDGDSADYFENPDGSIIHRGHNDDQWIRYRADLTGPGTDTPVLEKVYIYYQ